MAPSFILSLVHRIPPFQETHQNPRQQTSALHRLAEPPQPRSPTIIQKNCAYKSACAHPAKGVFANLYTGVDDTCSQIVHWRSRHLCSIQLVSIHTCSTCTGVQRHLFRACYIHHNKCTYTRACTPLQTVQQRLCRETLADRPRILKRHDGQRNLELKTMMMLQLNQPSNTEHAG